MRVVLFAPTRVSIYSRLLARSILEEPGLELVAIVVRSIWSVHRLRTELRRDGPRLLRKVKERLVNPVSPSDLVEEPSFARLAHAAGLPDDDLWRIAQKVGIPFIERVDLNGPEVEQALIGWKPAVIAFTGGGLVRKNILDIPSVGVLNCHSGLLPQYRGMDVVEWAILETKTGVPPVGLTLHLMDRGVDTGPILIRHPETIHPGDRLESLRGRLEENMVPLMMEGLRGLRDSTTLPAAQDPADGHQYFVMHPRLRDIAAQRLTTT